MQKLSKSRLMAYRQCPRRLWLQTHRPELADELDDGGGRLAVGERVGELARTFHPGGVLIQGESLSDALAMTQQYLSEAPRALFEATFQAQGLLVRADILLPEARGGWTMVEVKSSASVKPQHKVDAAIQAWVVRQAGLRLNDTAIAHIDTSFVYPGMEDYRGLLKYQSDSEELAELEGQVPDWLAEAKAVMENDDPNTAPGTQCNDPYPCPFLSYCLPDEEDPTGFPPEVLPRGAKQAAQLREEGYRDLRQVPADRLTHPVHLRVWEATINDAAILDPDAGEILAALEWPRYYVDFETIQLAIPVWAGTRPYAQIPFQWSCHIEHQDGQITHHEFLADGRSDPLRAFAESLLASVGQSGPIIVYNAAFERSRMKEMATAFPDLAAGMERAIERIFDLLPLARAHYYHPQMRGSWSIKAVLPSIAPDLAYDDLEVADGGMAQEAFAEMMLADTPEDRVEQLRKGLLLYCERDTWAMVRVAHHFQGIAHAE